VIGRGLEASFPVTAADPAAPEASAVPRARAATVGFIFAVVVLDMLALGMIVPVLPALVREFQGGDTARAAYWMGVFGVGWALMQFLFSPLVGALSDRFGRRPVLLGSLAGHAIDFLFMALAPTLWWLFVGRLISGVLAATVSTAQAYIADITPPAERAARFGLVGAAWGLGFVAGPALGGLLGEIDLRLPFWVAAGLAGLVFAFGLFFVPESLPPERRSRLRLGAANPLGALALLRSTPHLQGLALVHSLNLLAFNVLPSVFVLYAGFRYGWGEFTVGLTLGAVGLGGVIVSSLVVRPAVKALGERRAVLVGLSCTAVGYLIYGLAPVGWMFWVGVPIAALGQIYGAAVMSLMTQRVGADQQGRLQGATSSLMGLTGVVGPALFLPLFAFAIAPEVNAPGLPYLLSTALILLAVLIAYRVTQKPPEQG
jgi:DHA1 family tetracycline resistance protein-like MFS transporter